MPDTKEFTVSRKTSLRDVFFVLFKHKSRIAFFFIGVMLTAGIGTFFASRIYQSEAKLFVDLGREEVTLDSASLGQRRVHVSQSLENQINTEVDILQSQELMEQVVANMGVDAFINEDGKYAPLVNSPLDEIRLQLKRMLALPRHAIANFVIPRESRPADDRIMVKKIAKNLIDSLDVRPVNDSNIIALSFEAKNPQLSHDVLKQLIGVYMIKHQQVHGTPQSFEFFEKETAKYRARLEETEEELKKLKDRINVSSLEDQRRILSEQIGAIQQKREEVETAIASYKDKAKQGISEYFDLSVASESTRYPESSLDEMRRQLYQLKFKEQELLSVYKTNSVPVEEIRRRIKETEAMLHKVQEGTIEALAAKSEALGQQLVSANQELIKLNDAEVRLAQLERRKKLLEEKFVKYSDSLEQARIDRALNVEKISNIRIAQAPLTPIAPVRPNTRLNLLMGLFLGIFGGVGMAFFLEYIDDSLQKPQQIEETLELPVLGSIQKMVR